MNRFAQIVNGKVHWVFESTETLDQLYKRFASNIEFKDITKNLEIQEGWGFDGKTFISPTLPPLKSLSQLKEEKVEELRKTAEGQYIGGFYSSCLGEQWCYDSSEEDQRLIEGLYNRAKEVDWNTIERYPGVVPAGYAPIRVKKNKSDPDLDKQIKAHNKEQIIALGRDLEKHLFTVKVTHWALQDKVLSATNSEEVSQIAWIE